MRKRKAPETAKTWKTQEEMLEDRIIRLRMAMEYSEFRNEDLNKILKIGHEQFSVDLLKRLALNSKQPSAKASGDTPQVPLRAVWQDKRLLYNKMG